MNLRQAAQRALKAMEDGEYRADMIEFSDALIALRAALAEPAQEPVAWITDGGQGELWWYQSEKFDDDGNLIGPNPDDIPLYTTPPQRKPLPDMQAFDLADQYLYGGKNYGILAFVRAIERAHGIGEQHE